MFDGLIDTVKGWIASFIEFTLWRIFWFVEIIVVKFVGFVESIMEIFTGERTVKYNDSDKTLINIFFEHESVRGIYGGMALIGIVFCFVFAIISVIRRALDLKDKQQGVTMGMILTNLLKSILIISSMNLIMLVAIETTNKLVQQVSWTIQNGGNLAVGGDTITFTNEQYAAMGRIINTLGNYSLNPSYKSRYNLNACYNDIRVDLKYLGDQGVFNFHYLEEDPKTGKTIQSWQSLMEKLATAYDYSSEVPLDSYNDGVINAVTDCMEILKKNPTMKVHKKYNRKEEAFSRKKKVPMDRILFLVGTMGIDSNNAAARNKEYNKNPSFFDNARLPFYYGEQGSDIYSYDDVRKVFDPSPFYTNYVLVWFSGLAILKEMLVLIVTCSVRIFNLLALYIAAPLAIATMPMDDGGKFKQWTTAFIVQLLTIVGMVIAMRLFLMFIPIIWSPALKTSDNPLLDCIIKMVIQYGAVLSVNKVNGIFTGILADNAGFQAITAGDVRQNVENGAAGKMLSGMGAGAMAEKAFGKGRAALGKQIGKHSSKAAYLTDAIGLTEGAYEGSKDRQNKEDDKKAGKARKNMRDANKLEQDLDSMKKHGQHLDGTKPKNEKDKKNQIKKMENTLKYMKAGNGQTSLKDAKRMAERDMKEDKMDQQQQGEIEAMKLKNPPPKRRPGATKKNDEFSKPGSRPGPGGGPGSGPAPTPGYGPGPAPGPAPGPTPGPIPDGSEGEQDLPNRQEVESGETGENNNTNTPGGEGTNINTNQPDDLNQTNQGTQVGDAPPGVDNNATPGTDQNNTTNTNTNTGTQQPPFGTPNQNSGPHIGGGDDDDDDDEVPFNQTNQNTQVGGNPTNFNQTSTGMMNDQNNTAQSTNYTQTNPTANTQGGPQPNLNQPNQFQQVGGTPQMNTNNPQMNINNPQMNTNNPQMNTNNPQMNINNPQMNTNNPQMNMNNPQMNMNNPQMNTNNININNTNTSTGNVNYDPMGGNQYNPMGNNNPTGTNTPNNNG